MDRERRGIPGGGRGEERGEGLSGGEGFTAELCVSCVKVRARPQLLEGVGAGDGLAVVVRVENEDVGVLRVL